jgi:hypothetical protein
VKRNVQTYYCPNGDVFFLDVEEKPGEPKTYIVRNSKSVFLTTTSWTRALKKIGQKSGAAARSGVRSTTRKKKEVAA